MPDQYVIESAGLSRDATGHNLLPDLIGPFASRADAEAWIAAQGPLWGSWGITHLTAPESGGSDA